VKEWRVVIAEQAEYDIESIFQYIAFDLAEPAIAYIHVNRIHDNIRKLSYMPERYRIINSEPWRSRGVRRINVGNFAIFFTLDKETDTVSIFRVIYAKRDIPTVLGLSK
jgi:toxin ParE1/3/4